MKKILITLHLLLLTILTATAEGIGSWKLYPSYNNLEDVEVAGKDVFVLASSNLYCYNTNDGSLQTFGKTNALSDINITKIAWNSTAKRLVITYANYNIDLLSPSGDVINLPDYSMKALSGDKTINSITMYGQYAYIATGFGILKVDVKNGYISDSYNLNMGIKYTTILNDNIYALKSNGGILKASTKGNLSDPTKWTAISDKSFEYLYALGSNLLALTNGNLNKVNTATGECTQFGTFNFSWVKSNGSNLICGADNYFTLVRPDLSYSHYFSQQRMTKVSTDAAAADFWSNDVDGKLIKLVAEGDQLRQSTTGVAPDGPVNNHFWDMEFMGDKMYCTTGLFSVTFGSKSYKGFVHVYDGSVWTAMATDSESHTGHRMNDLNFVLFDPNNKNRMLIGGETGVYEYINGVYSNHWSSHNSCLGSFVPGDAVPQNWVCTISAVFDKNSNLWIPNQNGIAYLKPNGEMVDLGHKDEVLVQNTSYFDSAMFDSYGNLWWCGTNSSKSRVFCYNIAQDKVKRYDNFINQDGTPYTAHIHKIGMDKYENVWVLTREGPFYLKRSDITAGNDVFTQHKVPRNDGTNFADYLLSDIDVTCIAVDNANRKWLGTNGYGVYLISDDCNTEIQHFTTTTSFLPSDFIYNIRIDDSTGRVFISTSAGLCSYLGDITSNSSEMVESNVSVYPNPATPDYTGDITISGLTVGADVKILSAAGTLVHQQTSHGGSITWDGCDMDGRRVASGVYMIHAVNDKGENGIVAKLAIVR